MRKIILYSLLLVAALLFPVRGTDVGKLLPVELLQLYKEEEMLVITSDAGAAGVGTTVEEAIGNMKATANGNVYLDTADFLLVCGLTPEEVVILKEYLKPTIRICKIDVPTDPKTAAEFLRVHKPQQHLKEWTGENRVQLLSEENGRFILKEI